MKDTVTVTGLVATTPRHTVTSEGLDILSFRLASTQRKYDKGQNSFVDSDTNWYTVVAFRNLARNAEASLEKGHRIVVSGSLRVRDWQNDARSGTHIEIEAETIGHDLKWGVTAFMRLKERHETDELQPA